MTRLSASPALAIAATLSIAVPASIAQTFGPACTFAKIQQAGSTPLDLFAARLRLEGDALLVSAPVQQSAFLYRNVHGEWTLDHQFVHPTGAGSGSFGGGIAMSGDLVLVNVWGFGQPGEVLVFSRKSGAWSYVQTIADPVGGPISFFGEVMALEGDVAMIGGFDAVHVFDLSSGTAHLTQTITGTGEFGSAIAMHGDLAIIGARGDDQFAADAGVAYLVRRTSLGWKFVQTLTASDFSVGDANAADRFGTAVALNGTHAVIGAPGDDDFASNCGSAYVYRFVGDPPVLKSQTEIHGQAPLAGDQFGAAVAINHAARPKIIVGAPSDESPGFDNASAHVFLAPKSSSGDWTYVTRLKDNCSYSENSNFGVSVAVSEKDVALVGSSYTLQPVPAGGALFPFSITTSGGFLCECPCDNAADHASYGAGKPGTNGVPGLESYELPALGQKSGIRLTNALPGAIPLLFLGTKPTDDAFDGGHLLVKKPFVITIPLPVGADGTLTLSDAVPDNAALCGLTLYHQMMFVDPAAGGPYHTAQTPGLERTFGS